MNRWVVDTNVPVVANGRDEPEKNPVTETCREQTIRFLMTLLRSDKVLLDTGGEVLDEYRSHLNPRGEPGVGDCFYLAILQQTEKVERVDIRKNNKGEFVDLPDEIVNSKFHRDDRKFAAMSIRENVLVVNAVDSDWANHRDLLERNGVRIRFLCGCDPNDWREQLGPAKRRQ